MSPAARKDTTIEVDGVEVRVSSPDKIVFPQIGLTKLEVVQYYLAVAPGALRGAGGRPMVLKRFVKGIEQEAFFQKRVPENHPDYIDTATLHYARGTSAEEAVIRDAAGLAWVVNLGCLDLNPHPVRAEDLDHPDELRVDLDPMPGVDWSQIVDVASVAREVLDDVGLIGWPKTSGSRGLHILVRIAPHWDFKDVRLAAETLAKVVGGSFARVQFTPDLVPADIMAPGSTGSRARSSTSSWALSSSTSCSPTRSTGRRRRCSPRCWRS
jgi:bifunctional non-homologous end joining protein LigD